MWQKLLMEIREGNTRSLARSISLIENEAEGYENMMESLDLKSNAKIIGITGPPGAGKSTLVDALIGEFIRTGNSVGILCVDPSSPFNFGALLGDRVRMSEWYNHPKVFIRSLATRGSLGGLHPQIIAITDILKEAAYDYIIVETVGVGQSEVEIAGLADITMVVLVPEGGDEIQTMKAGLMEIADIFVVNKSDRPGADLFVRNLTLMVSPSAKQGQYEIPVLKTIASTKTGVKELVVRVQELLKQHLNDDKRAWLLAEQAYHLIQSKKMRSVNKQRLKHLISEAIGEGKFNLYQFVAASDAEWRAR